MVAMPEALPKAPAWWLDTFSSSSSTEPRRLPWADWSPKNPDALISPYDVPDQLIQSWKVTAPGEPGYDNKRKCYCWGYRPVARMRLLGINWGPPNWDSTNGQSWAICPDLGGACSCIVPPKVPAPPPCPTCPPPAKAVAPPRANSSIQPIQAPSPWGTVLGWLLPVTLVGGLGYYAYKKGALKAFKKKGR